LRVSGCRSDCAFCRGAVFCSRCEAENGDLHVRCGPAATARRGARCFSQEMHGGSGRPARPSGSCRNRHRAQAIARKSQPIRERIFASQSLLDPGVLKGANTWPPYADLCEALSELQHRAPTSNALRPPTKAALSFWMRLGGSSQRGKAAGAFAMVGEVSNGFTHFAFGRRASARSRPLSHWP
jgi:hypothetical protein